ncbi:MAG: 2Fe-2S iron-sulfur cluster binding domain-containing protein [Rhodoferax sp.]|nr:2Fe-2S iron-sulfur cluster binding domain-containing protein [Rhodoferax sp.]
MTSWQLVLWMVGAVLLQLSVYLAIGFWRHWQHYDALRRTVIEGGLPAYHTLDSAPAEPMPAAWSGWRTFKVTDRVLENTAGDICSFHLAPQDGQALPTFRPGQYLTFQLLIPMEKGGTEPLTRCYSLSDGPHPESYRVSIKRVPAPANSKHPAGRASNFFHDQVQLGSLLQVRAPAGHFHMDRSDAPVVLLGAGIGITPMLSMVQCCLVAQPGREVWLFYGVRQIRELMAQAELEAIAHTHANFHLYFCVSDVGEDLAQGSTYRRHGRIHIDLLRALLPLKPYHFYLCGPTPMLESLVPALEDWGVPDARIHFEAFGPASVKRRSAGRAAAPNTSAAVADTADTADIITFAKSGKQVSWQPGCANLLEFAETHQVAVNSGCRSGNCGSCQTTIRSGQVRYREAPDFDPEPGTCLLCVCTPASPLALEL